MDIQKVSIWQQKVKYSHDLFAVKVVLDLSRLDWQRFEVDLNLLQGVIVKVFPEWNYQLYSSVDDTGTFLRNDYVLNDTIYHTVANGLELGIGLENVKPVSEKFTGEPKYFRMYKDGVLTGYTEDSGTPQFYVGIWFASGKHAETTQEKELLLKYARLLAEEYRKEICE